MRAVRHGVAVSTNERRCHGVAPLATSCQCDAIQIVPCITGDQNTRDRLPSTTHPANNENAAAVLNNMVDTTELHGKTHREVVVPATGFCGSFGGECRVGAGARKPPRVRDKHDEALRPDRATVPCGLLAIIFTDTSTNTELVRPSHVRPWTRPGHGLCRGKASQNQQQAVAAELSSTAHSGTPG